MGLETVLKIGIAAIIALLVAVYMRLGDNQKRTEKLLENGIWEKLKDIEKKI